MAQSILNKPVSEGAQESFEKFVEAIGNGDAKVVKAFLAKVPNNLAGLNLDKEADRKTLLQAYASMKGAQINGSRRFAGGVAQANYTDANGNQRTMRMQMVAGCWKMAGE